jgi:hypothetical protein
MVKYYPSISEDHREWALRQQVFFIASAPLAGDHINISPKGLPSSTLSVFDGNHVAYMDATGSGIETVSHLHENGRATIMFCSFDKCPRIMRWFCKGRVIEWNDPEFDVVLDRMKKNRIDGARAILYFEVFKGRQATPVILWQINTLNDLLVQTSCGFAVPVIQERINLNDLKLGPKAYMKDRGTLGHFAKKTVEQGLMEWYQQQANLRSLDGLGGLKAARRGKGENMHLQDARIWIRRILRQWDAMLVGALVALFALASLRLVLHVVGMGYIAMPLALYGENS